MHPRSCQPFESGCPECFAGFPFAAVLCTHDPRHHVADEVADEVGAAGVGIGVAAGPVAAAGAHDPRQRVADEVVGAAGGGVGVAAAGRVGGTNDQQIHSPSDEGRLSVRTVHGGGGGGGGWSDGQGAAIAQPAMAARAVAIRVMDVNFIV